jgi:hypothetical protein
VVVRPGRLMFPGGAASRESGRRKTAAFTMTSETCASGYWIVLLTTFDSALVAPLLV